MVDKVTFTKNQPTMENGHVPFSITWEIQLKDGRRCAADVEAPADRALMANGFHLPTACIFCARPQPVLGRSSLEI
jgi:hypothetical protein